MMKEEKMRWRKERRYGDDGAKIRCESYDDVKAKEGSYDGEKGKALSYDDVKERRYDGEEGKAQSLLRHCVFAQLPLRVQIENFGRYRTPYKTPSILT